MKKLRILILLICLIVPATIAGCKKENKSTLSTPNIVEISGGTIIFDAVKNAEYYTVSINDNEISLNANHSNHVQIIDNKINYDASKIFVVGSSYSVKIKANASNANSSEFSESYSYKHSGNIKKPTNVKINSTTLTWNVVENASYYLVKIITPNDKVIFDKNNNVLTEDDPASIAKADLTEYSFNTNQFDFRSLLNKAGTYKFYVSAVLSDGTTYVESGYTTKITYNHSVQLSSPKNGQVYKIGEDLHLVTVLDPNANAISVSCDNFGRTVELNDSEQSITMLSNNMIDINLSQYFDSFIKGELLDFENIKQFSFKTESKFISNNLEETYYLDSIASENVLFENTHSLTAPILTLEHNSVHNCYIANWTSANDEPIGEFKLLVFTPSGVKEYKLDNTVNSMLITDNFMAVAIKAVGFGNYLSSQLSEVVANPSINNTVAAPTFDLNGTTLTWNSLYDAYYLVELNDEYHIVEENSFNLPVEDIKSNKCTVRVVTLKEGFKHQDKTVEFELTSELATPTFSNTQGFNSSKLYELTFTGTSNAIGYYVYVKSKNATVFYQIPILYTSTAIDLSQYIISEGEFTDYEVKVQAVADLHSIYSNSKLSSSVSVSHMKVLSQPEFYSINNISVPVTKQNVGGKTNYILKFFGVEDAGSYEILINYNKLTVNARTDNKTGLYEVNISNYLLSATNYEIMVRALPGENSFNVEPSEYAIANYALTKQLPMVNNILVTENDNVYTLSFDPVDNAEKYRVRIVKENDSSYPDYLNDLGLKNSFEITEAWRVNDYIQEDGVYYFYITALAPKENSYYADSQESSTYGYVNKLKSLKAPALHSITFSNNSKDSYTLSWEGDENADYYLVRLTDPNEIAHEISVVNGDTRTDINKYMTVQGTYEVSIYSMVSSDGENSKKFTSSPATNVSHAYTYQTEKDFLRYSVYMYGKNYDFTIDNIEDLKNILWYHYLYGINSSTGLSLMIKPQQLEDELTTSSLREAIINLATQAHNNEIYEFDADNEWDKLKKEALTSDSTLFTYICEKILLAYPEYNILQNFSLDHSPSTDVFNLKYNNALKLTVKDEISNIKTNLNYGNDFKYIDLYSRRSATSAFAIDDRKEMLVTTTEQLLQAVQHNRKPKFIGDSSVAETVYNNAKLVLSAIVSNNMSDLEKVTAIFDWLEYGFDLTYYNIGGKYYISGSVETDDVANYGKFKQYYLEGIFEDISMMPNGNIVIGNRVATSKSYSKAFALLCAIEGIDAIVVNGNYSYTDITDESKTKTVDHAWNKVYLSTSINKAEKKWYAVDLTFSDNRVMFQNLNKGYGMSSHTYFLTSDAYAELNLRDTYEDLNFEIKDLNHLVYGKGDDLNLVNRTCEENYNYYGKSKFAMSYEQINSTIINFGSADNIKGFEYLKEFNGSLTYQKYSLTSGYGEFQAFLLNALIYAEHKADLNSSHRSMFEFKYSWDDENENFAASNITKILESTFINYQLKLNLVSDSGSTSNKTVYSIKDSETTTVVFIVEKSA